MAAADRSLAGADSRLEEDVAGSASVVVDSSLAGEVVRILGVEELSAISMRSRLVAKCCESPKHVVIFGQHVRYGSGTYVLGVAADHSHLAGCMPSLAVARS